MTRSSLQKPPVVGVLAAGAPAPAPAGVFEKKPRPRSDVCFPAAPTVLEAPAFLNPAPGVRKESRADPGPPPPPPNTSVASGSWSAASLSAAATARAAGFATARGDGRGDRLAAFAERGDRAGPDAGDAGDSARARAGERFAGVAAFFAGVAAFFAGVAALSLIHI